MTGCCRYVQVYNLVSGKHNNKSTVKLNLSHVSNTGGKIYNMRLTHMHYNLRKHFFRIELLQYAIVYLTLLFLQSLLIQNKNRLEKFWANQDFQFDWNVDITGIGSHSINSSSYV